MNFVVPPGPPADGTWVTFGPDLILTFVGAILSVGTVVATYFIARARTRAQLLQALIFDLHQRRALDTEQPEIKKKASRLKDYKRANLSVLDMRTRIRNASDQIAGGSKSQEHLADMIGACNEYLEDSSRDPTRYQFHLVALKNALTGTVEEMTSSKRLKVLLPGEGARRHRRNENAHSGNGR